MFLSRQRANIREVQTSMNGSFNEYVENEKSSSVNDTFEYFGAKVG